MKKNTSLAIAISPILFLVALLSFNGYLFGGAATEGANQIALLLSGSLCAAISINHGEKWHNLLSGIKNSISDALPAIIILLLIGSLTGTWLISGIVPAMIYYGLQIVDPTYFLIGACLVSAIISLATGSSWSTIATVGIALLGIGEALMISKSMVAGAIISGAYFGDKMSPLSDTTNLAPAMAGTDLFTHIKYMAFTTIPSIVIALFIFLFMGFNLESETTANEITEILKAIESKFFISPILFLVPGVVILLIIKKVPAIPTLFLGTVFGGIIAIIFQTNIIYDLGNQQNYFYASFVTLINAMSREISISTSNEMINNLLNSGGMYGMLNTCLLYTSPSPRD